MILAGSQAHSHFFSLPGLQGNQSSPMTHQTYNVQCCKQFDVEPKQGIGTDEAFMRVPYFAIEHPTCCDSLHVPETNPLPFTKRNTLSVHCLQITKQGYIYYIYICITLIACDHCVHA